MGQLEVLAHPLHVHGHALHERDRAVLQIVEQDRRVGQDHPLDRGVGDVALVPQRDVLQRRLRVPAQHAREPGDLLALDRVALVRHRARALLPGAERLLHLAHLGALQVPDLGREPLQPCARERDRPQQLGVPVARHDLRGDVLARDIQALEHARLELGARRRVRADRPRDRPDGHLRKRALQPQGVAMRLEREPRELHPEGRRLGVDPVRATHAQRVRVLARARDQSGGERA